jgi:hypothetical protein
MRRRISSPVPCRSVGSAFVAGALRGQRRTSGTGVEPRKYPGPYGVAWARRPTPRRRSRREAASRHPAGCGAAAAQCREPSVKSARARSSLAAPTRYGASINPKRCSGSRSELASLRAIETLLRYVSERMKQTLGHPRKLGEDQLFGGCPRRCGNKVTIKMRYR